MPANRHNPSFLWLLVSASNGGPCIRNNLYVGNFPLLGKLSCLGFGDFVKVPPEVIVQCFFGRQLGHFDHLRFHEIVKS